MSTTKKLVFVLLAVLMLICTYLLYGYFGTVDLGERTVSIIIGEGENFTGVAKSLLDEGVVHSRIMLYYPARLRDLDHKLIPGRYDFTGKNSCRSVLHRLETADSERSHRGAGDYVAPDAVDQQGQLPGRARLHPFPDSIQDDRHRYRFR